jgi:hypothetical protein
MEVKNVASFVNQAQVDSNHNQQSATHRTHAKQEE